MPVQAVKIPQNVYVEDRIVGPVTLKQLGITGLGIGISYVIYATAVKSGFSGIPTVVICWSPTLVAAAFAFLKINDLGLLQIILLAIEGFNKPNTRYWSPHAGLTINLITRHMEKAEEKRQGSDADGAAKLLSATKELDKRRKEMTELGMPDQTPDNLEAVKTRLQHRLDQDDDAAAEARDKVAQSVDRKRVLASTLEPEKSIDGIADKIPTDNQTPDA
ncbi:MAG: PrgI family protein [Candidatus Peribacteraceae bacterium]|nr:PrgI family protein [Candidatus Peribacteraceae bacterium]